MTQKTNQLDQQEKLDLINRIVKAATDAGFDANRVPERLIGENLQQVLKADGLLTKFVSPEGTFFQLTVPTASAAIPDLPPPIETKVPVKTKKTKRWAQELLAPPETTTATSEEPPPQKRKYVRSGRFTAEAKAARAAAADARRRGLPVSTKLASKGKPGRKPGVRTAVKRAPRAMPQPKLLSRPVGRPPKAANKMFVQRKPRSVAAPAQAVRYRPAELPDVAATVNRLRSLIGFVRTTGADLLNAWKEIEALVGGPSK